MYVGVSICGYMYLISDTLRPEEGIKSHGAEVTGRCEWPDGSLVLSSLTTVQLYY